MTESGRRGALDIVITEDSGNRALRKALTGLFIV